MERLTKSPKENKSIQIGFPNRYQPQTMTHVDTLPETNSSPLKMDGWNTTFILGWSIFRGEPLVSGRVDDHQLLSLHDGFGAIKFGGTKLWSCKRLRLEKLKETKHKKHVTNGHFTRLGPRNHRFFNEVITLINGRKSMGFPGFAWGSFTLLSIGANQLTNQLGWILAFGVWTLISRSNCETPRGFVYIYIYEKYIKI